jgi:drug/metabolite transporter (DMT)-like permease
MLRWLRTLDWWVVLALAATYIFFGSGPAATTAAIKTIPPFLMVALRGVIAGGILTIWAVKSGATLPTLKQWRAGAIIGVLILAIGAGGGTYGQLTVASGVAGVLSALLPLLAACLGFVLFREKLAGRAIVGLLIGFAGIGLLLRPGSNLDLVGVSIIVVGQVGWAFGAELGPRVGLPDDPRLAAGVELLCGGAVLLLVALLIGDLGKLHLGSVTATSWLGFCWFIIIAVGGFTAFGFLTQTVAPAVATTFSYVNPLVAMTLGWLLFNEPLTIRMMLATATIVCGVGLIVSTKSESPRNERHPFTSGHGSYPKARHRGIADAMPVSHETEHEA